MLAKQYFENVESLVKTLQETQMDAVLAVGERVAPLLEKGGILYAFGTGHSHVLAEEIFGRAGGLVQTKALMPYDLTLDLTSGRSTLLERLDGYADAILETSGIRPQDAIIIISNSGRNAVPIQMAQLCKAKGVLTIALTNVTHSKSVSSRDKSGKKLFEVCDLVLDTCGTPGDVTVKPDGVPWSIGPMSTIAGGSLLQASICAIVEKMLADGVPPAVLQSSNLDGNDDANKAATDKLFSDYPELQHLLK